MYHHIFRTMHLTLVLLTFFCATRVSAQLLNTTEITPHIGQQYEVYYVDNPLDLQTGGTGINQVWNLANTQYDADTFLVKQAMPADSTPYASLFPNATIALRTFYSINPNDSDYEYFTDTGTTFCFLGYKGALTHIYSDPLVEFQFPFGYNNHTNDVYCFVSEGFGSTYSFCGFSDMHFDGVGTLILPYGSYDGVFRMTHEKKSWQPSSPQDTSVSVVHYWYKPGVRHPLATYSTFYGSNGASLVSATILSLNTINSIEATAFNDLNVYPNPFHQAVSLDLDPTSDDSEATVYSMDGKVVHRQSISEVKSTLQLGHLATGIYLLTLQSEGTLRRELLMKE